MKIDWLIQVLNQGTGFMANIDMTWERWAVFAAGIVTMGGTLTFTPVGELLPRTNVNTAVVQEHNESEKSHPDIRSAIQAQEAATREAVIQAEANRKFAEQDRTYIKTGITDLNKKVDDILAEIRQMRREQ